MKFTLSILLTTSFPKDIYESLYIWTKDLPTTSAPLEQVPMSCGDISYFDYTNRIALKNRIVTCYEFTSNKGKKDL